MEPIWPDVNLSILFTELPLLNRPAAAAASGFRYVELWWPFDESVPSLGKLRDLTDSLDSANVQLVALNFDAGDIPGGDRGLFSLPGHETRLKENIQVALEFAVPLGCLAFNALYGNRLDSAEPQVQDDIAVENLSYAAKAAQRIGATVLIESQNISDSPRYPVTRVGEAMEVINRVQRASGACNLKLLADLYHLHRMGEDLVTTIDRIGNRIGHVQIADDPGRHQPGTGEIAFKPALVALAEAGYRGYLGLEYRPLGPSTQSFGWLSQDPWNSRVHWQSLR